jgi:hypothetical protein
MSNPTRLVIQNGSHANDGNGDTLRDAATKINNNFSALWGGVYGDSAAEAEPISVNDLSDVSAPFASDGDLLVLSGSEWSNLSATHLDFNGLTNSDPNVTGRLWRDSDNGNVLKVSRG